MMSTADTIRDKLTAAFGPKQMEITDESHLHKGHAGAPDGGESHFRVEIVADIFDGLSRVDRQRRVYDALRAELAGGVHALALTTLTPKEAAARRAAEA